MNNYLILLFLLFYKINFGQIYTILDSISDKSETQITKKKLNTIYINEKITINGILDESVWKLTDNASNFYMYSPENGKLIPESKKTDVKVVYNNDAIYIGAVLKDEEPDKIMREITQRDDSGTADYFVVSINGYNDGQQEFRFFVTAAGVQLDCNSSPQTGEDFSWDAIWESKVKITNEGWVVEMKIPYSALRFSPSKIQTWGINFLRQIRRNRQLYSWTNIDNKAGSFEQQEGELHGIKDIKTPKRLFLFPYSSIYNNRIKSQKIKTEYKAGLDIKFGINDAFTFDAILIPDFGQTAFDDKILNLGPFEQQFNENRPFFTEGTDLFNKGNLFYSRRIGSAPTYYPEIDKYEKIRNYPNAVNLLNAIKLSGRTNKGLGIGLLNAITEKTEVEIIKTTYNDVNTESYSSRNAVVEPLTNYNLIVLDQRFNKNSSFSFINTSVLRNQHFRDANVSAIVWDLNSTKNIYNFSGDFKYSIVNLRNLGHKKGSNASFNFAERSGKIRYSFKFNYVSKEFDNNDLGINFQTNFSGFLGKINYRILKPNKTLNGFNANFYYESEYENTTGKIQRFNLSNSYNFTTLNNNDYGIGFDLRPFKIYDFYTPQTENRYVLNPERYGAWFYYSSNYNKKIAIDIYPYFTKFQESNRNEYGFKVGPRIRVSNKTSFIINYEYLKQKEDRGLATKENNEIIFGQRDVNTSSINLIGKYAFNNKMTLNLNSRYYWSYVENNNFLSLQEDGTLVKREYIDTLSKDFSSWNVDFSFLWWISPGSQFNILYRNTSVNNQSKINIVEKNLNQNFSNLFNENLKHSISVSLRYFLDYNKISNWF